MERESGETGEEARGRKIRGERERDGGTNERERARAPHDT